MKSDSKLGIRNPKPVQTGFTLVEMVTVIAITAIVAAVVAVFIRLPLQEYQDAQRRAEITDAADTAFTRIKRDLQTSLPNSVRVATTGAGASTVYYLEFLQVRTGGRYRSSAPTPAVASGPPNTCPDLAPLDGFADENVLQFGVADTCFTSLGALPNLLQIVANSDSVVVYNLGTGFSSADAYAAGATNNRSLITGIAVGTGGENVIKFTAHTFTLDSPGRRFQVISGPISYICNPVAGTLSSISGYAISAAQLTPPAGAPVLLAQRITACTITYDVVDQRVSVISIRLGFSDVISATAVNLFQQIQVSNVP
jgi:MSHA biogenesis protein MshO